MSLKLIPEVKMIKQELKKDLNTENLLEYDLFTEKGIYRIISYKLWIDHA